MANKGDRISQRQRKLVRGRNLTKLGFSLRGWGPAALDAIRSALWKGSRPRAFPCSLLWELIERWSTRICWLALSFCNLYDIACDLANRPSQTIPSGANRGDSSPKRLTARPCPLRRSPSLISAAVPDIIGR